MVLLVMVNLLFAQSANTKPDIVKIDFKIAAANKAKVKKADVAVMPAYKQLLAYANKALLYQPVSVMEKVQAPPSGDKHDYMSMGIYWWPDPSKPGGLPYIRKDGQVNPEVKDYEDKNNLPVLCEHIYILALAYYFSGDEKYARHAIKLIEVWFLDPATKMNPNLNYGQAIKGITNGRAEGLIETRHFIYVIDALQLLDNSLHWSPENKAGIKKWFGDFLTWMQTSPNGINEMNAKNNHGVWYDAQRLSMALYTGDSVLAKQIVKSAAGRLDKQLAADGSFPMEMARTNSFSYTLFVLDAYMIIAQLSEGMGTDFWSLTTSSGKSLKSAVDFVFPYIIQQKQWPAEQIRGFNYRAALPVLLRAGRKLNCHPCKDAIGKVVTKDREKLLINLL